jgi:hypothetical protein
LKEILQRCTELYNEEKNCDDYEKKENCLKCLKDSFYSKDSDTYDCLKKLATYTIEYGSIYVSEIYHFLEQSQILEENFQDKKINILSLGCGFKPDLIAIRKYFKSIKWKVDGHYRGYDIEDLWNDILLNVPNMKKVGIKDITDGFDCTNYDIIFMNKVFSTLKNHGYDKKFLKTMKKELKNLKSGSLVIFNDINSQDMGRDEFDSFAKNNSLEAIGKYFFNRNNEYRGDYTEIENSHNICSLPDNLPFESRDAPTKTVFFVYRKE